MDKVLIPSIALALVAVGWSAHQMQTRLEQTRFELESLHSINRIQRDHIRRMEEERSRWQEIEAELEAMDHAEDLSPYLRAVLDRVREQ